MIRIVLTLHSKVIYDNEVTRSVLDAVRFIFFVFFCTVCLMLLTAIEMRRLIPFRPFSTV